MDLKEFRYFTIFNHEAEEKYLREKHNNGWKLKEVKGFCLFCFEKCEPEDVIYQLDYNKEGMSNKSEYVKMFEDCGWEYIQDYVGYSYFRKSAAESMGREEIFCDDESRYEMLLRVFKGRLVPLLILLFFCVIPNLVLSVKHEDFFLSVFYLTIFALCAALVIVFGVKLYKFKNKIQRK